MSDEGEHRLELVMPFVVCRSQGGTYDDTSFVAGYRMGGLNAQLAPRMLIEHTAIFSPAEQHQADLIAMRHGYAMQVTTAHADWVTARFSRIALSE